MVVSNLREQGSHPELQDRPRDNDSRARNQQHEEADEHGARLHVPAALASAHVSAAPFERGGLAEQARRPILQRLEVVAVLEESRDVGPHEVLHVVHCARAAGRNLENTMR